MTNEYPVWVKGAKSAEAGRPLRHPRDKALLLLRQAPEEVLSAALLALIDRDPVPVLAALCDAIEAIEEVRHNPSPDDTRRYLPVRMEGNMPKRMPPSKNPVVAAFSREVRLARQVTGLSLLDASMQAGLPYNSYLLRVEQGSGCTLATAVRQARFFGISLDALYGLGDRDKAAA